MEISFLKSNLDKTEISLETEFSVGYRCYELTILLNLYYSDFHNLTT